MLGGVGYVGGVAERLRDFAAGFADRSFIVDDQKVEKIGGFNLRYRSHWTQGGRRHGIHSFSSYSLALNSLTRSSLTISSSRLPSGLRSRGISPNCRTDCGTSGRSTETRVPHDGALSTWMRPPFLLTMSWTVANPNPVPVPALVVKSAS